MFLVLGQAFGYYSRARNLQSAAKEIVVRHAGEFPREYEHALALPGIGRYTAAAVLSIAYEAPHAVLDGNVATLSLARIFALCGDHARAGSVAQARIGRAGIASAHKFSARLESRR